VLLLFYQDFSWRRKEQNLSKWVNRRVRARLGGRVPGLRAAGNGHWRLRQRSRERPDQPLGSDGRSQGRLQVALAQPESRWLIASAPRFYRVLKTGKIAYLLHRLNRSATASWRKWPAAMVLRTTWRPPTRSGVPIPGLFLDSDHGGIPGETEEDFQKSAEVFKPNLFDYVEIYRFTPRSGTRAAKWLTKSPSTLGGGGIGNFFSGACLSSRSTQNPTNGGDAELPTRHGSRLPGNRIRRETRGEELIAHR